MKVLEHYQFRLRPNQEASGVGQGRSSRRFAWQASDHPAMAPPPGGTDRGGIELALEFNGRRIIDWLWEDLSCPTCRCAPRHRADRLTRSGSTSAAPVRGSTAGAR